MKIYIKCRSIRARVEVLEEYSPLSLKSKHSFMKCAVNV